MPRFFVFSKGKQESVFQSQNEVGGNVQYFAQSGESIDGRKLIRAKIFADRSRVYADAFCDRFLTHSAVFDGIAESLLYSVYHFTTPILISKITDVQFFLIMFVLFIIAHCAFFVKQIKLFFCAGWARGQKTLQTFA